MRVRTVAVFVFAFVSSAIAQQMADPRFETSVIRPAYTNEHPKVAIDEAHHNFHTADERYRPLAELLRHDGYAVVRGTHKFSARSLETLRVLVVANALGAGATAGTDTSGPAFTQKECDAVRDWVRSGGSLLLISDHTPFGAAAEMLGHSFGVQMGKGFAYSLALRFTDQGEPTVLAYSRENGLLGDHPITRGREASERISRVVAFTGQSLSVPEGATVLMQLAPDAREAASRADLGATMRTAMTSTAGDPNLAQGAKPASGAQGIAMAFGKGRVVVLGEAALMTAQVIRRPMGREFKMGMNVSGNDDRQFALNILHWLSGLLD